MLALFRSKKVKSIKKLFIHSISGNIYMTLVGELRFGDTVLLQHCILFKHNFSPIWFCQLYVQVNNVDASIINGKVSRPSLSIIKTDSYPLHWSQPSQPNSTYFASKLPSAHKIHHSISKLFHA